MKGIYDEEAWIEVTQCPRPEGRRETAGRGGR